MHKCYVCHRDLPDSEFTPSYLAHHNYLCRSCSRKYQQMRKAEGKTGTKAETWRKYRELIKQRDFKIAEEHLEDVCGGLRCVVLNMPNPDKGEFIYTVYNTGGAGLKTNDKAEFLDYLQREA